MALLITVLLAMVRRIGLGATDETGGRLMHNAGQVGDNRYENLKPIWPDKPSGRTNE